MSRSSRYIYAVSFILGAAGFLLPLWPLSVLGVLLCALSGRFIFALFMGLLLDIAWGAPSGTAQYLFFPFAALALGGVVVHVFGVRYFFDRTVQEKI
jgi:hypothetical protein